MINKMKKILKWHLPSAWMAMLMLLVFAAAILPLFRLAMYAVPSADDYNYGIYVKGYLDLYGRNLKSVWDGAIFVVRTWWYCWQGTYSSIFFMSIVPSAFGEQYYHLGIIAILAFFIIAAYVFVDTVLKKTLMAEWQTRVMGATLIIIAMLEFIYTAQQGIYWYNAAVHYTFMHGWAMLLLAAALQTVSAKNKIATAGLTVFMMLASSICGGSNFVTALQGFLAFLCICGYVVYRHRLRVLLYVPSVLIYAFGLYMNVSAPGNVIRGDNYTGYGAVQSVLLSFKGAFIHLGEFVEIKMMILLLVFVLFMWNTLKKSTFSFRYPAVITLLSFCFYATGFTPSLYGMGSYGLSRTFVVVKFTLQLLLFINAAYWAGWYMQKRKNAGKKVPEWRHVISVYGVCAAALLVVFAFSSNQAGTVSSYGAYYYVHTGEAANFKAQYDQRIETIKNSGDDVVVEPYIWKPWFLCGSDISTNPDDERNHAMAQWYDKSSIAVRE